MASEKQRAAARKNIRKAARAAREQRTIAHLPKSTRTALGRQAAKVAKQKKRQKAAWSFSAVKPPETWSPARG